MPKIAPQIVKKRQTKVVTLSVRYHDMNTKNKHKFIDTIMKACDVKSEKTVYRWISGETIPTLLEQKEIARRFKVTVEEIFKPL